MKNLNRLLISLSLLLFFSLGAQAQGLYQKGKIQISKKKQIEAYIQIDYRYPQRFQEDITYITPKVFAKWQKKGKRLKSKNKIKLKLKNFESFSLDNGQNFRVVKYADLTKKKLGMLPKRLCLEEIALGKIRAYKFYSHTTGKISHELADVVMDSKIKGDYLLIDYIQDNFQILVQKTELHKNPRNLQHANLLTLIGDNERVLTNYQNNEYGFRNQFTERQKFGVIVNKNYEAAFLSMVKDYNDEGVASLLLE